jgi:RNA exonuclease NGL2
MLTNELTYYQPTILCLQEVDLEQYEPYFVKLLESLQYDHVLLAAKKKRQGLVIAWKRADYELSYRNDIHYDKLNAGSIGPTMWTGNVALCLGLKCKEILHAGIWISNTHLYWHPRGSYERQRQAGVLVSETIKCAKKRAAWPIFICGGISPVTVLIRFQLYPQWDDVHCTYTTTCTINSIPARRIERQCDV